MKKFIAIMTVCEFISHSYVDGSISESSNNTEESMVSLISTLEANSRNEEVSGIFNIGIPISKVEITDKYRIITAHGVYNGKSVGFKLQIPLVTESWNLDNLGGF